MAKKKSTSEILTATLQRLEALAPASFAPDPASTQHENLQRFVASGLCSTPATFDADLENRSLRGLFTIPSSNAPMSDGGQWLEVMRTDDPHYAIGVVDDTEEDPYLMIASTEENWDDNKCVPLPDGLRPLARLSALLPRIKRR